jgi:hypothetical protein
MNALTRLTYIPTDAIKKGVEFQIGKMRRSLKASDLSSPAQLSNDTRTPKSTGKRKATKDADAGDSAGVEDTPSQHAKKTKTKLAEIGIYDDGVEDVDIDDFKGKADDADEAI